MSETQLAYAIQLRDSGATVAEIVAKTGLTRSTLYRHLPARRLVDDEEQRGRRADPVTAAPIPPAHTPTVSAEPDTAAGSGDRLECPTCGYRPETRREMIPHLDDLDTVWLHLDPGGQVRERRHCAHCQPHEQVVAVSCTRCAVGPLISAGWGR